MEPGLGRDSHEALAMRDMHAYRESSAKEPETERFHIAANSHDDG